MVVELAEKVGEGERASERSVMYCGGEDKQWSCGKAGTVNLRKVSSIVRDIGDPCLSQSPVKVVVTVRLHSTGFYYFL